MRERERVRHTCKPSCSDSLDQGSQSGCLGSIRDGRAARWCRCRSLKQLAVALHCTRHTLLCSEAGVDLALGEYATDCMGMCQQKNSGASLFEAFLSCWARRVVTTRSKPLLPAHCRMKFMTAIRLCLISLIRSPCRPSRRLAQAIRSSLSAVAACEDAGRQKHERGCGKLHGDL